MLRVEGDPVVLVLLRLQNCPEFRVGGEGWGRVPANRNVYIHIQIMLYVSYFLCVTRKREPSLLGIPPVDGEQLGSRVQGSGPGLQGWGVRECLDAAQHRDCVQHRCLAHVNLR